MDKESLEFVIIKNGIIHDKYWIENPDVKEKKNKKEIKNFWNIFLLLYFRINRVKPIINAKVIIF